MAAKINGKKIGPIGFGMMGLTISANPPPPSTGVECLKAALNQGSNFWNGADFYGPNGGSIPLLVEYFTKYPSDSSKVVLSIKGAFNLQKVEPDNSPSGIRKSLDYCLDTLKDKAFIDVYEPARIDPKVPIEDSIAVLAEYVKAGKIGGIGLSECSASTIRRAQAIHPISAVEVELSLFTTDILTDGVAATCTELGIPLIAYSPLSRGILTKQLTSFDDLPENDRRRMVPRFQPDAFDHNRKLVDKIRKVSERIGCTLPQTAIGWVCALSGREGLGTIVPIPGASSVERVEENLTKVDLSDKDMEDLKAILKKLEVKGLLHAEAQQKYLKG